MLELIEAKVSGEDRERDAIQVSQEKFISAEANDLVQNDYSLIVQIRGEDTPIIFVFCENITEEGFADGEVESL